MHYSLERTFWYWYSDSTVFMCLWANETWPISAPSFKNWQMLHLEGKHYSTQFFNAMDCTTKLLCFHCYCLQKKSVFQFFFPFEKSSFEALQLNLRFFFHPQCVYCVFDNGILLTFETMSAVICHFIPHDMNMIRTVTHCFYPRKHSQLNVVCCSFASINLNENRAICWISGVQFDSSQR